MKQVLEELYKQIVDHPDEVSVKEVIGEQAHVYEVRVAYADYGKIIGRQGAHAKAVRTLLVAAGMKKRMRYMLEIIETQAI